MTNYSLPSPLALLQNNNNSLANPEPAITHLHYIHTDSTPPITSSSTTSVIVINPIYNLLRVFLFWPPSKQHTTPDYTTMSNQWLIRRRCLNIDYAINCIPIGLLIRVHSTEQQSHSNHLLNHHHNNINTNKVPQWILARRPVLDIPQWTIALLPCTMIVSRVL